MSIELTTQQKAVVTNRGGSLLVSAAAGSGKTKVLVDRIMARVCEDGVNIDSLLIITYTKAAAAELRGKITSELSRRLSEEPGNEHLRDQMKLLGSAQISTVHAFCSNLLHNYAMHIGLPQKFRVAEEQEMRALRADSMADLLEQVYHNIDKKPDVRAFIEELAFGRDDSAVPAILYSVYDTIQSHPWPQLWIEQCLVNMDISAKGDASETPWGKYLLQNIKSYVMNQVLLVEQAMELCDTDEGLATTYHENLKNDHLKMTNILTANRWDEMADACAQKWTRLSTVKKGVDVNPIIQERVKTLRNRYKKAVDQKGKALSVSSAEALTDLLKTAASVRGMFQLVEQFETIYTRKKRDSNVLDFSDLEHESIKLLLDAKTHDRTPIAQEVARQYAEIMVDEYQDSNSVQETIFSSISNGSNLFYVGDVKQSIYGFRLADPSIFLGHYHSYTPHQIAKSGEPRKILLTKNFRSRPEILEATNAVMKTCMSMEAGGIDYEGEELLIPGRTDFVNDGTPAVEFNVIDTDVPSSADDEAGLAKVDIEAKFVAGRIRKMLDEEQIMDEETGTLRPVKASDIAILMRSPKNSTNHYAKALSEQGIAVKTSHSGSLLDTTEVATIYCFLQVIENPLQDVPLVAVLASPLFGFTAEDLAQVRIAKKDARYFYESLKAFAASSEKAKAFLSVLDRFTNMVQYTNLSTLYYHIIEETEAKDVFGSMQNGEQRIANLYAFGDVIAGYERTLARSLFRFICYIESMRELGVELPQPNISTMEDAVTIQSIHTSKGLEYPVVFLADLSRRFNMSSLKSSALLDRELGVGVQAVDKDLMYRYPTIARTAIASKQGAEMKSEELRLCYVGMTRAKQKLVMSFCDKAIAVIQRLAPDIQPKMSAPDVLSVDNPGQWILFTAMQREESHVLYKAAGTLPQFPLQPQEYPWNIKIYNAGEIGGEKATMEELDAISMADDSAFSKRVETTFAAPNVDELSEALAYRYPHQDASLTPSVVSVSTLNRGCTQVKVERPNFEKLKKGATPQEKGTATHKFMQYANFKACTERSNGVTNELFRLREHGYLLPREVAAVQVHLLANFFQTSVGLELASLYGPQMHREVRFNLQVTAKDVLPDSCCEDHILLKGIIDCYVETPTGLILLDYKTDFVNDSEESLTEKAAEYQAQMDLYGKALEIMTGKKVVEKNLILLRLSKKIQL